MSDISRPTGEADRFHIELSLVREDDQEGTSDLQQRVTALTRAFSAAKRIGRPDTCRQPPD